MKLERPFLPTVVSYWTNTDNEGIFIAYIFFYLPFNLYSTLQCRGNKWKHLVTGIVMGKMKVQGYSKMIDNI